MPKFDHELSRRVREIAAPLVDARARVHQACAAPAALRLVWDGETARVRPENEAAPPAAAPAHGDVRAELTAVRPPAGSEGPQWRVTLEAAWRWADPRFVPDGDENAWEDNAFGGVWDSAPTPASGRAAWKPFTPSPGEMEKAEAAARSALAEADARWEAARPQASAEAIAAADAAKEAVIRDLAREVAARVEEEREFWESNLPRKIHLHKTYRQAAAFVEMVATTVALTADDRRRVAEPLSLARERLEAAIDAAEGKGRPPIAIPTSASATGAGPAKESTHNPFAGLAGLMKK